MLPSREDLKSCLEGLKEDPSSSCTLDKTMVLLYWEGRILQPNVQVREGCTWSSQGGRRYLPSQPNQPNQLKTGY